MTELNQSDVTGSHCIDTVSTCEYDLSTSYGYKKGSRFYDIGHFLGIEMPWLLWTTA